MLRLKPGAALRAVETLLAFLPDKVNAQDRPRKRPQKTTPNDASATSPSGALGLSRFLDLGLRLLKWFRGAQEQCNVSGGAWLTEQQKAMGGKRKKKAIFC